MERAACGARAARTVVYRTGGSASSGRQRRVVARAALGGGGGAGGQGHGADDGAPVAAGLGRDWREARARLVREEQADRSRRANAPNAARRATDRAALAAEGLWAHRLANVEPGALLLPRFNHTTFFNGKVVLLTDHHEAGSAGLVLNAKLPPSRHDVVGAVMGRDVVHNLAGSAGFPTLFCGGPVGQEGYVAALVTRSVPGCTKLMRGVYVADATTLGMENVRSAVAAGELCAHEVRLFNGASTWAPGQLHGELVRGLWTIVAASPRLVNTRPADDGHDALWAHLIALTGNPSRERDSALEFD